MQVKFTRVEWPYASVFRISSRAQVSAEAVQVELRDGAVVGRGEGQSSGNGTSTVPVRNIRSV